MGMWLTFYGWERLKPKNVHSWLFSKSMYITCALSITVKVNVGMIILLRSNSPLFFRCKHDVSPFHLADTYFNYLMMEGDSELSPKSDLQVARSGPPAAIFGFWSTSRY